MTLELIHDRGRGPEIRGTRITVFDLISRFIDPMMTEARICMLYDLTPDQVAAARAYVFNHAESVLAEHLGIERRIADRSNLHDPDQANKEKTTFLKFKEWLVEREEETIREQSENSHTSENRRALTGLPTFRDWLIQQETKAGTRS